MKKQDIEKLIKNGENERVEFKEKFDDSVIETLTAFANRRGGKILAGVTGKLYGHITIKDLERDDYVSSLRNKLLAEMFYLMGDIEKYGTGFIRIRKILKHYPAITLHFEEIGDYFKIDIGSVPQKSSQKSSQKILEMIIHDSQITIEDIAGRLEISDRAVKKNIQKLKKEGMLRRIGPDKGGHWKVLK